MLFYSESQPTSKDSDKDLWSSGEDHLPAQHGEKASENDDNAVSMGLEVLD